MTGRCSARLRRVVAAPVALAAVMVLVGCSQSPPDEPAKRPDGKDTAASPFTKDPRPQKPLRTRAELRDVLLGLNDLGPDWTGGGPVILDGKTLAAMRKAAGKKRVEELEKEDESCDAVDEGGPVNLTEVEGMIAAGYTSSLHQVEVTLLSQQPQAAERHFDAVRRLIDKCDNTTERRTINKVSYDVAYKTSGTNAVGDESVGMLSYRSMKEGERTTSQFQGNAVGTTQYARIGAHTVSVTVWDRSSQSRGTREGARLLDLQIAKVKKLTTKQ